MDLYGLGWNIELVGDFLVGETVEVAEHDDLAATVGQGTHRIGEDLEFVALVDGFRGARLRVEDDELRLVVDGLSGVRTAAAEKIEGGVAGGGEEKGLGVADAAGVFGAEEAGVGLLHEVVVIAERREAGLEVGAQGGFMG